MFPFAFEAELYLLDLLISFLFVAAPPENDLNVYTFSIGEPGQEMDAS